MNSKFDFSCNGKFLNLPEEYNRARFALIDHVICNTGIIHYDHALEIISEIAGKSNAGQLLNYLVEKNIIGLNSKGDVEYLYPVSCVETGHKIVLEDGRDYFAMCAIDSLGAAATFQMKAELFSFCKDTDECVHAIIDTDKIVEIAPSGLYVSYYDKWNDKENDCNY